MSAFTFLYSLSYSCYLLVFKLFDFLFKGAVWWTIMNHDTGFPKKTSVSQKWNILLIYSVMIRKGKIIENIDWNNLSNLLMGNHSLIFFPTLLFSPYVCVTYGWVFKGTYWRMMIRGRGLSKDKLRKTNNLSNVVVYIWKTSQIGSRNVNKMVCKDNLIPEIGYETK